MEFAIVGLKIDAEEMGVEIDWQMIHLNIGEDYDEYSTFGNIHNTRLPYLEIKVPAERKSND